MLQCSVVQCAPCLPPATERRRDEVPTRQANALRRDSHPPPLAARGSVLSSLITAVLSFFLLDLVRFLVFSLAHARSSVFHAKNLFLNSPAPSVVPERSLISDCHTDANAHRPFFSSSSSSFLQEHRQPATTLAKTDRQTDSQTYRKTKKQD